MEIQKEFRELLELLNRHNVLYVIVGGYALAFHGVPRYTGDIDIFFKPDEDNAGCILKALDDFGFGSLNLSVLDFSTPGNIIQLGYPPMRVDFINTLSGVSWDGVYENTVPGNYGDVPVKFIGKNELIINKRSTGRYKDTADLEALGERKG